MTARAASQALSRRSLVAFAACVAASGVAGSLFGCGPVPGGSGSGGAGGSAPTTGVDLPGCFTELESMRTVGRRYLELNPALGLDDLLSELDPGRGFSVLESEIREQYARGEVALIDGWPLALTELRLYAVVALS